MRAALIRRLERFLRKRIAWLRHGARPEGLPSGRRRAPRRTRPRPVLVGDSWFEQRRALAGGAGLHLRRLAYYPPGLQNPYLRLLYAECPTVGFDPRPLPRLADLFRLPPDSVFHLHWTRAAQVGSVSEEQARAKTEHFLDPIRDFVARGGRLLWSVHEALPHECAFPAVEISLRRELVRLATGVHVLHPSTVEEVAGSYALDPAKVFVVEHPLYRGVYPEYQSRDSARRLLGLEPDEVMLLGFGAIRPYKGFDRLVAMLEGLREQNGRRLRAMIAGPTLGAIDNAPLLRRVATTFGASISDEAVPEENVQALFRAADVVALPYRAVLNSGVLMLALSFGCRAVAPDNPVTRDTLASGRVHLFDRESDADLRRALCEAIQAGPAQGELPTAFAARHDPTTLARSFASSIEALLEDERTAATG